MLFVICLLSITSVLDTLTKIEFLTSRIFSLKRRNRSKWVIAIQIGEVYKKTKQDTKLFFFLKGLSRNQFSSVAQCCLTLCDPMNCSMPGLPVHHQLPRSPKSHVHWVGDAIQPSGPLSSPSPPALNFSQHQGLFKWVSSLHQVAKILEFQLQHQSVQWIPRTDL